MRSEEYEKYIHSDRWRRIAQQAKTRAGERCQRCKKRGGIGGEVDLQVHHLTYENLGNEKPEDLKVVCRACHEVEDAERSLKTGARKFNRRLDGWARKKYGEDWFLGHDPADVEEEFEEWLEEREN